MKEQKCPKTVYLEEELIVKAENEAKELNRSFSYVVNSALKDRYSKKR